ncbi:MAG: hypothetical protein AB7N54_18800 [Alphaproteobacteria bacterium]
MTNLPTSLQQQLEAKRRAVESARRSVIAAQKRVETLEAELRGFEEATKVLLGADQEPVVQPEPAPSSAGSDRRRGLSELWKSVIAAMSARYPRDFSLSDIERLCAQYGTQTQKTTIRSQMHIYSEQGLVERTMPGRFRVTPTGAVAAGVQLDAEPSGNQTGGNETADDHESSAASAS